MTCREFLERYSEYDDSLIPSTEADRFRRHMEACGSCARYDRVLRKGRMVARQLERPEPSPDFIPRLRRRLLQQTARGRMLMGGRIAAALAAVTILMVATSAVRLMESAPAGATDATARSAAERTAADGIDRLPSPRPDGGVYRLAARTILPVQSRPSPRAWSATEVAPAGTASYSPLETGPPAYRRAPPSSPDFADSDRRALD